MDCDKLQQLSKELQPKLSAIISDLNKVLQSHVPGVNLVAFTLDDSIPEFTDLPDNPDLSNNAELQSFADVTLDDQAVEVYVNCRRCGPSYCCFIRPRTVDTR